MKALHALGLLLPVLIIPACQKTLPVREHVTTVQSTVFVPVKPELTRHPAIPQNHGLTCEGAIETARERRDLLAQAYAQLDAISGIQGTKQAEHTCPSVRVINPPVK